MRPPVSHVLTTLCIEMGWLQLPAEEGGRWLSSIAAMYGLPVEKVTAEAVRLGLWNSNAPRAIDAARSVARRMARNDGDDDEPREWRRLMAKKRTG